MICVYFGLPPKETRPTEQNNHRERQQTESELKFSSFPYNRSSFHLMMDVLKMCMKPPPSLGEGTSYKEDPKIHLSLPFSMGKLETDTLLVWYSPLQTQGKN